MILKRDLVKIASQIEARYPKAMVRIEGANIGMCLEIGDVNYYAEIFSVDEIASVYWGSTPEEVERNEISRGIGLCADDQAGADERVEDAVISVVEAIGDLMMSALFQ